MNIPVFDLHCDTALALLGDNFRKCGSLRENNGHIDLKRAGSLSGYAQCFACFTSELESAVAPVDMFERQLATIHRELQRNNDTIKQVYCAEEVRSNLENGMMSAILTIEGPAGFGYDPGLLEDLYLVGFRTTTLGWNESNVLTGSCKTGGGLTRMGREYVRTAQRLGMLVDVSHMSDEGFRDVMEITEGAVIASHSNSRSICPSERNLTDEMFRDICSTGGVAGINLYTAFVGHSATLDSVCDHVIHFLELDPTGKHIALGGDLDGCDSLPQGFSGVSDYPFLADRLLERGVDEKTVRDIFWNNALEVFDRCSM